MPALAHPAATLERGLRTAVRNVYKQGNLEELTVRRIRRAAEVELGLEEGFFKSDEGWKERSKRVISEEVDAQADANPSSQPPSAQPTPKKMKQPPAAKLKEGAEDKERKRKAADEGKAKKRRKKQSSDDDDDGGDGSRFEEEAVDGEEEDSSPRVKKRRAASTLSPPPEEDEVDISQDNTSPTKSKTNGTLEEGSESEMSVLIDESPKKKGRLKTKKPDSAKTEKKRKVVAPKKKKQQQQQQQPHQRKPSTTAEEPADPDQEEIKRLQGWLVKCGIRKMWWKELQPYETSKAKIRHLKEMLAEAGMSGRYSVEKASQIREERELRADLEAVQEGARIWGKEEEEDEDGDGGGGGGGRPRRQVARGLQGLDFLNDEDGEETD